MYKVEAVESFRKDLKKLPQEMVKQLFARFIPRLQEDPSLGKRLHGKALRHFWKLAFRYKRNDYRLVYEIHEKEILIVLIAIGSRENFYQKFARRIQ